MAAAPPPTRPALRDRYDRRRRVVVAVAARLFAERGYQATSIGDLSAETGLAAGGLYHYFAGKDDLLIAVCDELLEPLLAEARAIVGRGGPAADQLRGVLRAWLAHIESHQDHMRVFAQERHVLERGPQWSTVRRQRKAFERLLEGILARGEADGTLAFADRRLTLLALLGMVNHVPQWLRPGGRLSAEQIADGFCDLVLRAGTP